MVKTDKYTFLTVFLTLVFAFGSMAGMNFILWARERQLLTESGSVAVESPVRAWQEQEEEENSDKEGYTLTTGQMEEAVTCWNERDEVIFHSPVNGQISIEEAVKAGEEWLAEMGMGAEGQENEAGAYSVNAMLGVAAQESSAWVQLEPYYSFWMVHFSSQSMRAVLYLNAVTGKVWSAEITLYEELAEKTPYEKLERFVELSGLPIPETEIVKNQEGTQAFLQAGDSRLWAKMELLYSKRYGIEEFSDGSAEMFYNENVRILYQLTVVPSASTLSGEQRILYQE